LDTDFVGSDQKDYSTDGDVGGFNFKGMYGKDVTSDDHGKWPNSGVGVRKVARMLLPTGDSGRHKLLARHLERNGNINTGAAVVPCGCEGVS